MKIRYIIIALIVILTNSCDKIEAPYRETVVAPDFCTTGIDDSIPNRKVLVEDYTGHLCGNCPPAGVYLNDTLDGIYDHCLVVITVHAGFYAGYNPGCLACGIGEPAGSFRTNYNTAAGTAWYNFFNISSVGVPIGMVNRTGYPATNLKTYTGWAPALATELTKPAQATLTITNDFTAPDKVDVEVVSNFVDDLSGDYSLQVVITEDSLVDWQYWYPPHTPNFVPDYLHRHVLRDVLNGTWGESIVTGGASAGASVTKSYSNYTINSGWNIDHCSIVAFIYNTATYEIVQVEEMPVR